MRVGHNPLAGTAAPSHVRDIVLTCVTHLPNMEGYHAQRFEVIKTSLESAREHAGIPHTFAVWDNGSCPEFRDWLQFVFKPGVLILSANIGKNSARTSLFRMQKPDSVICFSDDDIYFYPDWLKPQLELLQNFPNVACVSGYPVRTSFRWGNTNTKEWAKDNAKLETGRFLPEQWEDDFAVSIGRDIHEHRRTSLLDMDARITYKGFQAYATAHHCQFIGYAKQLNRLPVYDNWAMGSERGFDEALDKIGLRLTTVQRYSRHIGNVLHDELRKEIEAVKEQTCQVLQH